MWRTERSRHGYNVPLKIAFHHVPFSLVDDKRSLPHAPGIGVRLCNNPGWTIRDTLWDRRLVKEESLNEGK